MSSTGTLFSVLILTLNEERNIENCIKSLSACDDVVVLDSYSKDATEVLSKKMNARFYQRKFDNYAAQRNHGLNEIEYKHDWLLMLDADEELTDELSHEIDKKIQSINDGVTMYRFRRKDFYMGKWVKRSSGYPTWFGRLLKVGCVNVERAINEEYHTSGRVLDLKNHINHYPFNNGLSAWVEKHNRYSTMEARYSLSDDVKKLPNVNFFSKDPIKRRKAQKQIVYAMPFRPLIVFILFYIVRGGFLDGIAGFRLSLLKAFYEMLIVYKKDEFKREASGKTI